jgi:hypothetical protein
VKPGALCFLNCVRYRRIAQNPPPPRTTTAAAINSVMISAFELPPSSSSAEPPPPAAGVSVAAAARVGVFVAASLVGVFVSFVSIGTGVGVSLAMAAGVLVFVGAVVPVAVGCGVLVGFGVEVAVFVAVAIAGWVAVGVGVSGIGVGVSGTCVCALHCVAGHRPHAHVNRGRVPMVTGPAPPTPVVDDNILVPPTTARVAASSTPMLMTEGADSRLEDGLLASVASPPSAGASVPTATATASTESTKKARIICVPPFPAQRGALPLLRRPAAIRMTAARETRGFPTAARPRLLRGYGTALGLVGLSHLSMGAPAVHM